MPVVNNAMLYTFKNLLREQISYFCHNKIKFKENSDEVIDYLMFS